MHTDTIGSAVLETWTPQEVADAWEANKIVLIDVRTVQEYSFEHIDGALLLPMAFLKPEKLPGQSDKRIVFYCGSGVRSDRVVRLAIEAGLTPVAHMEGGFAAWKAAKLPIITTDMATGAPKRVG